MPVSDIYRSSAFGANQLCPIFAIVIFYFGMSGTMKVKAFLVTEIIILTMYLFDLKVSAISMLCITTIIEITFSKKNMIIKLSRGRYPCSTRAYRPRAADGSYTASRWRAGGCSNMPGWW